jgi:hypothetical protein
MRTITKKYIIKTWDELTEEEKEKEIEKNSEQLYCSYDNSEWEATENCLNDLMSNLKIIHFRDNDILKTISFDDNSQGWWIDRVIEKNIYATCDVFDFEDIELILKWGRLHTFENDFNNNMCGCYCYFNQFQTDFESGYYTFEELEKLANTKTQNGNGFMFEEFYNAWNEFKKEYNYFVEQFNLIINEYFNNRYNLPQDYIDFFFEDMEFEFLKEVHYED